MQLRQFNPEHAAENDTQDRIEQQQNRAGHADHHDNAGDQEDRDTDDRNGISVGHSPVCRALTEGASVK